MEEKYYELQKSEIEAIKLREIEDDCRKVCDYISDYLSGVPVYDGADFLGVAPNTKDLVTRYKLLSNKIMAIEKETNGFSNIFDYKTGLNDLRYPNLTHLYWLYNKVKEQYALHMQANSYSTELSNIDPQQDATTSPYYDLTNYIDGGTESIEYMIKHKQPRDGVQLLWKSAKGDAQLLHIILGWDLPTINKCIRFKKGKPLTHGDRLSKMGGNPYLRKILQGLK